MSPENRKISGYSYLRITATVAVVILHISSSLIENHRLFSLTGTEFNFYLAVWSLMQWGVPCFVILTGALFLKKEKTVSLHDCVFKYARRIFLALLIFGIPFAFLAEYADTGSFSLQMIPNALIRLISDNTFSHMWYLYMLLGLYLFLPLIKVFMDHCSRRVLEYILGLLFLFTVVFPVVSASCNITIAFRLPVETCYLFYLLFGGYLVNYKPKFAQKGRLAVFCIAACCILFVVLSIVHHDFAFIFSSYNSPFTALVACSLFVLFQKIQSPLPDRVWSLDRLCFGVYLLHPVFVQLLYRTAKITPTGSWFPLKFLGTAVIILLVTFGVSWLLNLIKPLRKYVL